MRIAFLAFFLVSCGGTVTETPPDSTPSDSGADTIAVPDVPIDSAIDVAKDTTSDIAVTDTGASDLVVSSTTLGDYEGKLARFVVTSRVDGSLVTTGSGRVDKGAVSVRLASAMSHDVFGVQLDVYIDLAEDGACNGTDPAWDQLVTNDFSKSEIDYTFDPKSPGTKAIACSAIGK